MEEVKTDRKLYVVHVSFWMPDAGPVQVWAKDEEHAKEMAKAMLPQVKDLSIHDVVLYDNLQKPDGSEPPTSDKPKVIN